MRTLPAYQQSSALPVLLRDRDPKVGHTHRAPRTDFYKRMTAGGSGADEAIAFSLDRSIMETELALERVDVELALLTSTEESFTKDLPWIERLEILRDRYISRLVSLVRLRHQLRSPGPISIRGSVTVQNAATNQQVQVNVGGRPEKSESPETESP